MKHERWMKQKKEMRNKMHAHGLQINWWFKQCDKMWWHAHFIDFIHFLSNSVSPWYRFILSFFFASMFALKLFLWSNRNMIMRWSRDEFHINYYETFIHLQKERETNVFCKKNVSTIYIKNFANMLINRTKCIILQTENC